MKYIQLLKSRGLVISENDFYLHQEDFRFKMILILDSSFIYSSKIPIPIDPNLFNSLSSFGRSLLQKHQQYLNLFRKLHYSHKERDEMIRRYNKLSDNYLNSEWSDAMINMGSILEIGIIQYYKESKLSPEKNLKWFDCMKDYIAHKLNTFGDFGKWRIICEILRKYRNLVHIKLCKDFEIDEVDYQSMKPIFNELIKFL